MFQKLLSRNLSSKPYGYQLVVFVLLCVFSALLAIGFSNLVLLFTPYTLSTYQAVTEFNNPQWVNTTIALQIISTIMAFGLPAILFAYFAYPSAPSYLGLLKTPRVYHLLWGLLLLIVSYGLVAYLAQFNKTIPMPETWVALETKAAAMTKALLDFTSVGRLILTLFYIAFLPALLEELFFRACLQNILMQHYGKRKAWLAIVITAIIFALLHGQMQTVLPRVFLGVLLGLCYYKTGSLWVSIAIHFFNNGIQVFLQYLHNIKVTAVNIENTPTISIWIALVSTILSLLAYKMFSKQKENYICHIATNEQLGTHI